MRAQAILFDLDGTLLDTLDDLADSMNRVLGRLGCPVHERDAYRYFIGDGMEALVRRALPPDRRDEATAARARAAMVREYGAHYADKTAPYPGVPELLDALAARGLPAAIFSNKPHRATVEVVAELLPRWRFAAVRGAVPDVPKKPDPAGALAVARELGVAPPEVAYVGDTGIDMRTARGAGMRALGALWGFRTAEELREAGAEHLLAHPLELLDWLDDERRPPRGR
ncbi:MAG: HAD family hydrolase [Deferrisomatales bacterium]